MKCLEENAENVECIPYNRIEALSENSNCDRSSNTC